MQGQAALQDVEDLVLAPVDEQRRHVAPATLQLDDGDRPAALLAADANACEVVDEPDRVCGDGGAHGSSSFGQRSDSES
jgi:hypothetical protein